jgi:hypothetical protein
MKRLIQVSIVLACLSMSCKTGEIKWKDHIDGLSGLDVIKKECFKYSSELSSYQGEILQLGRDTSVAPEYFELNLYQGLDNINEIESKYQLAIPAAYKSFLSQINGGFINDISLFGLPKTWLETGLVDRSVLEPLNLYTANETWIDDLGINPKYFIFGSSPYSDSFNINYLIYEDRIYGALENEVIVENWPTIDAMLEDELNRLRN